MEIKCPRLSFFDPSRRRIGSLPCIMHPGHEEPFFLNSVIPALMLSPVPEGVRVWTFLHMDAKSAKLVEMVIGPTALPAIFDAWVSSPEHFAVTHLGWWPRQEAPFRSGPYIPNKKELGDDIEDFSL